MSISSSEGSPLDLTAKYQKLAAEYAKARAYGGVLKRALVEEQTSSALLKETIKSRDQTLRKHDQELDSLLFRNQQLTRRVTFLQEELDRIKEGSKKGRPKHNNGITEEESKLFQAELQTRIIENTKLLSQLDERELELQRERRKWQETKEIYEKKLADVRRSQMQALRNVPAGVKNHERSDSESWSIIKKLPFSSIYQPLISLFEEEIDLVVQDLDDIFKRSSQVLAISQLDEHLNSLKALLNEIDKKRYPMIAELLVVLVRLDTELMDCFEGTLPFQLTDALNSISSVVEKLNLVGSQYKTKETNQKVLKNLIQLKSGCESFQRVLKQFSSSNKCQFNLLNCQEEIESLEKTMEPCPNGPVAEKLASELQSKTVLNEFGDGIVLEEPAWMTQSVKHHIGSVTNYLISDRQAAESRITSVLKENEALKSRLEHYCDDLHRKEEAFVNLQEELSVTSRNYEEQLSSMSEHMANMNDKLAAQQTMIEELTYELSKKDMKKTRTK